MRELTFNEWMVYIHEQLNYPKEKLKTYAEGYRFAASVQKDKRCTPKPIWYGNKREKQDHSGTGDNQ